MSEAPEYCVKCGTALNLGYYTCSACRFDHRPMVEEKFKMERLRERMEIAEAEYQKELPKLIKHSVNALKLGGLFLALSLFLAFLNGAKVAEVPAALVWLGFIIGSSCIVYGSYSFPKR